MNPPQVVQTVRLHLLLAIRAFFVEFADACNLGAVSDSALRLGLDFKNVAEGQVRVLTLGRALQVQRGASDHTQGFEDKNLGSSPGLLGQ